MTNRSEYAPVKCVNIPKRLFQEKQYEKLSVDAKLWLMGRNIKKQGKQQNTESYL